jgi:hypothetical protein
MTILAVEMDIPYAENIMVTADTLTVDLSDGRTISVPLVWYPRLMHATPEELKNWRLIGKGQGVHWEDIDEDISIEGLFDWQAVGRESSLFQKMVANTQIPPNIKTLKLTGKTEPICMFSVLIAFFCYIELHSFLFYGSLARRCV